MLQQSTPMANPLDIRGMVFDQGAATYSAVRNHMTDPDTDDNMRFSRLARRERSESDSLEEREAYLNLGRPKDAMQHASSQWLQVRGMAAQTDYPEEIIIEPVQSTGSTTNTRSANRANYAIRGTASARYTDFEAPNDNPRLPRKALRVVHEDERNDYISNYIAGSVPRPKLPPLLSHGLNEDEQIDERALAKKEYKARRRAERAAERAHPQRNTAW